MPQLTSCEFVPYLSIQGANAAIEFYSKVFGVEPYNQLTMPDGRVLHCEFRIGSARFFISEELPEHGGAPSPASLKATTVAIHVYVDDCDALVDAMCQNKSEQLMAPTDMFWGERFARVRDPFGHEWGISTVIKEMAPSEIQSAANQLFDNSAE